MHKRRRGIVGIEAAIILIAFVIVAAAVAFVALNMGMTASQKSKEAMSKGLAQASTALEVDGDVIGYTNGSLALYYYNGSEWLFANNTYSCNDISSVAIPLRVAPGWNSVDLSHTNVTVIIRLPGGKSYVYGGLLNASNVNPLNTNNLGSLMNLSITNALSENSTSNTTYWINQSAKAVIYANDYDGNLKLLTAGEKAWLIVYLPFKFNATNSTKPTFLFKGCVGPYGMITVEILPPKGAPLTVTRYIPATIYSKGTVDLG